MIIAKHLHDDLKDPRGFVPGLSAGVCAVIRRMMERDRGKRYPDMGAVDEDLGRIDVGRAAGRPAPITAASTLRMSGVTPPSAVSGRHGGWDPQVLARIEARLAAEIGPMAKVVVKREADKTADVETLCAALGGQIAGDAARRVFLADARAAASTAAHRTPAVAGTAAAFSASAPPDPARRDSSESIAWNPEALRALETRLAESIGPVARVLVKKASRAAGNWTELVGLLAINLATPAEQAAFRSDAAKLAK